MYSHRYVPADGEVLTAILAAAYLLADRSDSAPIQGQGDGPAHGMW
jgi:hypothetical protein